MAARNELAYGHTGTGKSEGIIAVTKEVLKQRPGKKARVWVGDGSAVSYHESGLVDAGLVEVFSWENRDWPATTLNQIAEGYKPKDPNDPKSPLIPPTPDEMNNIVVWAFEGISVAGRYLLSDIKGGLAWRAARGEKIGQDSPFYYSDCEKDQLGNCKEGSGPGTKFGGNAQAHYGEAQKRLLGWIERAKALPGDFMFMTGHERTAEDKVTKENVIGVEAAGGAITAILPSRFNNTLHFVQVEKRLREKDDFNAKLIDDLETEHRIYTRSHISPTTMQKYLAVTRGGWKDDEMPAYIVSPNPGDGLLAFYGKLAELKAKRAAALKAAA